MFDSRVMKATIEALLLGDTPRRSRILAGPCRGATMILNRSTQTKVWVGMFDRRLQRELKSLARADDVAFDVGAYQGFFSLLLSRTCQSVVAVEPDPRNVADLRTNIALNDANISVVHAAVAAVPGKTSLLLGVEPTESRLVEAHYTQNPWSGSAEVTVTTLDELADRHGHPGVIKIDVEGAEAEVLRGGDEVLARRPPIACEIHDTRAEVEKILVERGYRIRMAGERLLIAS
jgi:FkbM family methyltransferase